LVGVEELFQMPALGKVAAQQVQVVALVGGAEKRSVMIGCGRFSATLDDLGQLQIGSFAKGEGAPGGGDAGPVRIEQIVGQSAECGVREMTIPGAPAKSGYSTWHRRLACEWGAEESTLHRPDACAVFWFCKRL
jgi:hypothetical protein